MGADKIIAKATVSMHPNGLTEAEAIIETPQLREIVRYLQSFFHIYEGRAFSSVLC